MTNNSDQQLGASKSPTPVNTGSGDPAPATIAAPPTVEPSAPSTRRGKRATGPAFSRQEALEMLQQTIITCRLAGIQIRIARKQSASTGKYFAGILITDADYIDGNLVIRPTE